jgi:hypothetical protein
VFAVVSGVSIVIAVVAKMNITEYPVAVTTLLLGQRRKRGRPQNNGRRAGFWLGDGRGVEKGRMIAGVISENYHIANNKVLWLTSSRNL